MFTNCNKTEHLKVNCANLVKLNNKKKIKTVVQHEENFSKQYQPPNKKPEKELQNAYAVYRANFDM